MMLREMTFRERGRCWLVKIMKDEKSEEGLRLSKSSMVQI